MLDSLYHGRERCQNMNGMLLEMTRCEGIALDDDDAGDGDDNVMMMVMNLQLIYSKKQ